MNPLHRLKFRAASIRSESLALHFAYQNPATGLLPKLIILITLGYALSPVDLIPDFIPVLGYIDDLIIIPALISLSIKLIPGEIMAEARLQARESDMRPGRRWIAGIIIISVWLLIITVLIKLFFSSLNFIIFNI